LVPFIGEGDVAEVSDYLWQFGAVQSDGLNVVGKVKKADFTPGASTDVAPNQGALGVSVGEGGIAAVGVASLQVVNEVLTEIKVHGSFAKFFQQITEVGAVEGSGASSQLRV
jgi:hypothetical protein